MLFDREKLTKTETMLSDINKQWVGISWWAESVKWRWSVEERKGRAPKAVKEIRIFSIKTRGSKGCSGVSVYLSVFLIILPPPDTNTSRGIQFDSRMKFCLLISGSDGLSCMSGVWLTQTPHVSLKESRRPAKLKDNKGSFPSKRKRSIRAWSKV